MGYYEDIEIHYEEHFNKKTNSVFTFDGSIAKRLSVPKQQESLVRVGDYRTIAYVTGLHQKIGGQLMI